MHCTLSDFFFSRSATFTPPSSSIPSLKDLGSSNENLINSCSFATDKVISNEDMGSSQHFLSPETPSHDKCKLITDSYLCLLVHPVLHLQVPLLLLLLVGLVQGVLVPLLGVLVLCLSNHTCVFSGPTVSNIYLKTIVKKLSHQLERQYLTCKGELTIQKGNITFYHPKDCHTFKAMMCST